MPTPRGLQAHNWGVSLGPHPGGVSRSMPKGVYPSMHWGRPPPPIQTATAAGGTHPSEMHSCLNYIVTFNIRKYDVAIFGIHMLVRKITSLIKKSADWSPPNYHKTDRRSPKSHSMNKLPLEQLAIKWICKLIKTFEIKIDWLMQNLTTILGLPGQPDEHALKWIWPINELTKELAACLSGKVRELGNQVTATVLILVQQSLLIFLQQYLVLQSLLPVWQWRYLVIKVLNWWLWQRRKVIVVKIYSLTKYLDFHR